jgi:hypothetical protein
LNNICREQTISVTLTESNQLSGANGYMGYSHKSKFSSILQLIDLKLNAVIIQEYLNKSKHQPVINFEVMTILMLKILNIQVPEHLRAQQAEKCKVKQSLMA